VTDTTQLIDQLAARATPVQPLASPFNRMLRWLAFAIAFLAMLTAWQGLRAGVLADLAEAPALVEWLASLATGLTAAYAAFQISVPGRSPLWAWLPVPPLLVWLSGIGLGCARDVARMGADAWLVELASSECAVAITMTSLPLGLVLLLMVRHAGVVRPGATALLAALGAAAVSAAGVTLHHPGESAFMVLLWHLGAVALLSLSSLLFGRSLFAWIGHARAGAQ
jgi:hypothetical protein